MIASSRLPYHGTKVDPEQTKLEINKLLKQYGITDYQWTEYKGESKLEFATEIMWREKLTELHCILRPPELKELHRVWDQKLGRNVKKMVPNIPVAYRLMKDHLKNRLALVSCGAYAFEDIFLQDLTVVDQFSGEQIRLAEFMRRRGQIPGLQLPDKSEETGKVIETTTAEVA